MNKNNLNEASLYDLETEKYVEKSEEEIKQMIIDFMEYQNPEYTCFTEILKKLPFEIISLDEDPNMTAAIDLTRKPPKIFLGEGAVNVLEGQDSKLTQKMAKQLSVLMRHEIYHYLLTHQKRLMSFYGKDRAHSSTWHSFANILEDFEVNRNVCVTEEDKEIIRQMQLNLQLCGGLLEEDLRPEFAGKSLEEMLAICDEEIEKADSFVKAFIENYRDKEISPQDELTIIDADLNGVFDGTKPVPKYFSDKYKELYSMYINPNRKSHIVIDLKDYIDNSDGFKKYPENIQNIVKEVFEYYKNNPSKIKETLNQISKSGLRQEIEIGDINNPIKLRFPEEKYIAEEALNNLIGNTAPKQVEDDFEEEKKSDEYVIGWNSAIDTFSNEEQPHSSTAELYGLLNLLG